MPPIAELANRFGTCTLREVAKEQVTIFRKESEHGIDLWAGDPSCQHAHEALLAVLSKIGNFIGATEVLGHRRQGNLGEFISLQVAANGALDYSKAYAQNAFDPLQNISRAGLDITYLYFEPIEVGEDLIYIQEVKTTGGLPLSYADGLTEDYEKLFGEDPDFTLNTRVQGLAMMLEVGEHRIDLARRLEELASTEPRRCTHVRLIPTVVHEKVGTDPVKKLLAIKSSVSAFGWHADQIQPWSIGFENLIDRLTRMARGQK